MRELLIYADESDKKGPHFGNFYAGAAIWSADLQEAIERLEGSKQKLGIQGEVKWGKVKPAHLSRYAEFVDTWFKLLGEGRARMRVMFTQRHWQPQSLTQYHHENAYHLLYYQFLKHAFGLQHLGNTDPVRLRLYLDQLPTTREQSSVFKSYIAALGQNAAFRKAKISFATDQIAEVDSKEHVVLQAVDLVLGSMQFRLNDKHLVKLPGSSRRGKRTLAKEQLYKHINAQVRQLYPNFNIGITTGQHGDPASRWRHPYRHWMFKPSDAVRDRRFSKRK